MISCIISFLTIFFIIQIQARAQSTATEAPLEFVPEPVSLPGPVLNKIADKALNRAYSDTFKVLSETNRCSEFFGGPRSAITVLNRFFSKLRKEKLPAYVTITMTGKTLYVTDALSGAHFRLFEKTLLNEEGAFYQRKSVSPDLRVASVGSFLPATRPARSLTLLHELGHMIRSPTGEWLLLDDGYDAEKSRRNTETIQRECKSELIKLDQH
jgi:hypothetical protein